MTKAEKLAALNQILLITQGMQDRAQAALWEDIAPLEQQRKKLFDLVFPLDSSDVGLRGIIEQILALNNSVEAQCRQAKDKLQQELAGINQNKKAMSAYLMS